MVLRATPSVPLVPSLAKTAASLRGWRSPRVPPPRQPPALEPTMQLPVWPHLPPPSDRLFAGEAGRRSTKVCVYGTLAWVFSSTRCCVSFLYIQNARVCWPPLQSRLFKISGTGERVERWPGAPGARYISSSKHFFVALDVFILSPAGTQPAGSGIPYNRVVGVCACIYSSPLCFQQLRL